MQSFITIYFYFLNKLKKILDVGIVVWATGLTANPFVKDLHVSKSPSNRIITDDHLRVLDEKQNVIENVYALGDCATIQDVELPATAQVASQKSIWLTKYLNAKAKDPEKKCPVKIHA